MRTATAPLGPATRLGLPDLFRQGRFEQVLIATFGADLEFYERVLRRHFGNYRNQIVLADRRQLAGSVTALATTGALRHVNRSWLAGPLSVSSHRSAHAKLILLAGPEAGLLLVGSGNLNLSGYAGAGECFTPYQWSPDEEAALAAFTAVRAFTEGLVEHEHVDKVTADRLDVYWSAYDWWHEPPVTDGPVRHNLDSPLGVQFVEAVGHGPVEELVVVTPFHDPGCAALERLASELKPKELRVLVQPGHCSVDPDQLSRVVGRHNGEVHTITARDELSATYLHAKIVLAKTAGGAVCLTGSANCSIVALWSGHPEGNLELGNLAIGERDAFDHLLGSDTVAIAGPVDPAALELSIKETDDAPEVEDAPTALIDLRWKAPTLKARVAPPLDDESLVTIEISGRPATAVISLSPAETGWTALTAELTESEDIEAVDSVAVVSVRIGDAVAGVAVPYQVERLQEQDRRRVDVDRLRHAAHLELEDPDLEQALAALEEILVSDNVARWGRDSKPVVDGPEGPTISWDDIDWGAVRRHPRFSAYGSLSGLGATGSALAGYLEALSEVVRDLLEPKAGEGEPGPGSSPNDDEDEQEPDVSEGVEGGAGEEEELDEAVPDEPGRSQSPAARNRRVIRNFVRRNLAALEQPAFRDGAGPGIVIPNAIILNWVCWWVATKDEGLAHAELIDERLRLWDLLWGDVTEGGGYLEELDDEHQLLVLDRFSQQHFEAVTVASIADVWASVETASSEYRRLRQIVRRAVCHPCWQVTGAHLAEAAVLTNGRPTTLEAADEVDLAARLWDAACQAHSDLDVRTGTPPG